MGVKQAAEAIKDLYLVVIEKASGPIVDLYASIRRVAIRLQQIDDELKVIKKQLAKLEKEETGTKKK